MYIIKQINLIFTLNNKAKMENELASRNSNYHNLVRQAACGNPTYFLTLLKLKTWLMCKRSVT